LIGLTVNGAERLSHKKVLAPGAVGKNGGVDHLATGTAFPSVEHPDKVMKFLCVHPAFAFWAFHLISPLVDLVDRKQLVVIRMPITST